jgi:xylulokinase
LAYIGIDIGTSGCKACVVDENGCFLKSAHRDYPLVYPRPGWVELDPGEIRDAAFGVLRELSPHAKDVKAIAVSSIGESFVLLDKEDNVLANTMTYLDQRSGECLGLIAEKLDPRLVHTVTSVPLNQMYSLPKLLWLKDNRPEVFEKADKIMLISEYISYILCGERASDYTLSSRTMLFDVRELSWSSMLMERFGMPASKFSPPVSAGTSLNRLRPKLAEQLGLSPEIKVYAGCHDQIAATLGAGAIRENDVMGGQGSTESLNVLIGGDKLKHPEPLLDNQLSFEPFVVKGLYSISLGQLTYGASIKWYIDTFESELRDACEKNGASVHAVLDERCARDSGDTFFLPYLSKVSCMDVNANAPGAFMGLHLAASKSELYRALLEGLCFESRKNCECLGRLGVTPKQIILTGGCTRSDLLTQIKSDVLNLPARLPKNHESGIIGLAMVCAVACGDCAGYGEAVEKFVQYSRAFYPGRNYDGKYAKYKEISDSIIQLYRRL